MRARGRLKRNSPGERMQQVSIAMRPATLKTLDGLTEKVGLSRSAVINQLIERALAEQQQEAAA